MLDSQLAYAPRLPAAQLTEPKCDGNFSGCFAAKRKAHRSMEPVNVRIRQIELFNRSRRLAEFFWIPWRR